MFTFTFIIFYIFQGEFLSPLFLWHLWHARKLQLVLKKRHAPRISSKNPWSQRPWRDFWYCRGNSRKALLMRTSRMGLPALRKQTGHSEKGPKICNGDRSARFFLPFLCAVNLLVSCFWSQGSTELTGKAETTTAEMWGRRAFEDKVNCWEALVASCKLCNLLHSCCRFSFCLLFFLNTGCFCQTTRKD